MRAATGAVVTDPPAALRHPLPPSLRADIVSLSRADDAVDLATLGVAGQPFVIRGPGEYEAHGIFVIAVEGHPADAGGKHAAGGTLYCYDFPGLTVCHLGNLGRKLSQGQLEALGDVHVLLLPVGLPGTLSPTVAVEVVNQIDPAIVVPMYHPPVAAEPGSALGKFLNEIGAADATPRNQLRIDPARLPEEPQVMLLNAAA